jgi:SAM-dependent methyltransferase
VGGYAAGRPCPACGAPLSGEARPASASEAELRASGPGFGLAICSACGSAATLGEAPHPARAHETAYYEPTTGSTERLVEPLRRLALRDMLRHFRGLEAGARVLEVGCGDGRLLAALAGRGLLPVGIEPAPGAAARARRRGVEVIEGTFEEAAGAIGSRRFDAVVFWHSLEHFGDPAGALARAHALLDDRGELIVAVPNRSSWQARIGGDLWFHQDVPRHRVHFSERGLRALLGRSGFRRIRVSHLLVEQNPLGMWQTLLNRLTGERDQLFRTVKRDPTLPGGRGRRLWTFALSLAVAPAALLAELAAGLARAGGTIVAVAEADAG